MSAPTPTLVKLLALPLFVILVAAGCRLRGEAQPAIETETRDAT